MIFKQLCSEVTIKLLPKNLCCPVLKSLCYLSAPHPLTVYCPWASDEVLRKGKGCSCSLEGVWVTHFQCPLWCCELDSGMVGWGRLSHCPLPSLLYQFLLHFCKSLPLPQPSGTHWLLTFPAWFHEGGLALPPSPRWTVALVKYLQRVGSPALRMVAGQS